MLNLAFHSSHALVWKEGKYFVAKCLEIEVASQGESKKEVLANLKEAVELYLEDEKVSKLPPGFFLKQPQLETFSFKA